MPTLFMTGASGFIGRQFLTKYADRFETIILPLRKRPDYDLPENVKVRLVAGRADEIAECLLETPCSHILNAAAYGISPGARDADDMVAVNTDIPVQLAKAAQRLGSHKFVQLGTMSEYQRLAAQRPIRENDLLSGDSEGYGGSKAQASRELEALSSEGVTQITCLRLFGVFGPGEGDHRLVVSLYNKLSAGLVAPMSLGTQVRDFIYIIDVLDAIYLALIMPVEAKFKAFNIGSGVGVAVGDFARAFCSASKLSEDKLDFGALPMRDTDVPYIVADIRSATKELGWKPEWSPQSALQAYAAFLADRIAG